MEQAGSTAGFSVLDLGALVMGAAIASVHVLRVMREDLSFGAWIMIGAVFAGVTATSAGPFIFLARRYVRRQADYPRVGDRLWALFGIPWLATAIIQSATPVSAPRHEPLFSTILSVGLGIVCMIALTVVWSTWVMVPPDQAARIETGPWTNRIGLIVAIAWPLQCGLGMVVLS
jgi:hypothetical protein